MTDTNLCWASLKCILVKKRATFFFLLNNNDMVACHLVNYDVKHRKTCPTLFSKLSNHSLFVWHKLNIGKSHNVCTSKKLFHVFNIFMTPYNYFWFFLHHHVQFYVLFYDSQTLIKYTIRIFFNVTRNFHGNLNFI